LKKKPKPNRNRVKPTGFDSVRFDFLGQKPVWLGFLGFGLVFSGFGSVFSVWLGFFGFARFFFGFGSVRFFRFFGYKTETELNRPAFSKI
jgi:hypothetical protein